MQPIVDAILREVEVQDAKWGVGHDAGHTTAEWIAILTRRLGLAFEDGEQLMATEARFHHLFAQRKANLRRRFVQVAAVAVSAIRAIDSSLPENERLKHRPNPSDEAKALRLSLLPGAGCHAGRQDGECNWKHCPQERDGEPQKSGRHCPLDRKDEKL